MCGFTGVLGAGSSDVELLSRMADTLSHRGPDNSGVWFDVNDQIGLAHRRLAVIDLSDSGNQPMESYSKRYVMVFNGEIYNHRDIRHELSKSGFSWKGTSDTESVLAGLEVWGIHKLLKKCVGMFALAVWDRRDKSLMLARDRIGEKPLYYGWQGVGGQRSFIFGSELKALKVHPGFQSDLSQRSLNLFLRYGYVPSPASIYQGISKLEPGTVLTVTREKQNPEVTHYWSFRDVVANRTPNIDKTLDQLADELKAQLQISIRDQIIADVPVGAFLSGGIDSSLIVCMIQEVSPEPVRTFTIGFNETEHNEANYAKAIASYVGTEHQELYVSSQDLLGLVPRLATIYDEPFADSSQIPTLMVSQLAREQVTVCLSGDAGDELFGGYTRYHLTEQLWRYMKHIPLMVRKGMGDGINRISPDTWQALSNPINMVLPRTLRQSAFGDRIHKLSTMLGSRNEDELYAGLTSAWPRPEELMLNKDPVPAFNNRVSNIEGICEVERMMCLDTLGYLPDDILTKVDRAAMSVSLETRIPFLDHRIIELAWNMPLSMKIRNGQTKLILRRLLSSYLPKELYERPKTGFGIPLKDWLRGPLRNWAEDMLSPENLNAEGNLCPEIINTIWRDHISGTRNWSSILWNILMFLSWRESEA